MKKNTVTEPTGHPCEVVDDPLTEVLRSGAQRLLVQAIEAEAEAFLALMADWKLEDGRARFVRHGHGPERSIQTGIGVVPVQRAKIRDRGAGEEEERIRFTSAILPRWARRSPSLEALLPVLYLRGVSTGDFQEALSALLGPDAPNLSPSVLSRLNSKWEAEYTAWQKRDLSGQRFVYVWADGVYLQARMESQAECMLPRREYPPSLCERMISSADHSSARRRTAGRSFSAFRWVSVKAGKAGASYWSASRARA